MKEQLAEAETNLKKSKDQLEASKAQLEQSEAKLTQAIQSTITMLQNMGCDDTFICSKLCEIYRLSEAEALCCLKNNI